MASHPGRRVECLVARLDLGSERRVGRHVVTVLRQHVVDRERRVRVVAQEVVEPAEHVVYNRVSSGRYTGH